MKLHDMLMPVMHCRKCLAESSGRPLPGHPSVLDVTFTPAGTQVWCQRHQVHVAHVPFGADPSRPPAPMAAAVATA